MSDSDHSGVELGVETQTPLLPAAWRLRFRLTALGEARLAPLFTQALHGALAPELATVLRPAEPSEAMRRWLGLTDGVPLPYSIFPCSGLRQQRSIAAGDALELRATVLGSSPDSVSDFCAALTHAGDRGLGARDCRARFEVALLEEQPLEWLGTAGCPPTARLLLSTPARIKHAGRVASELDEAILWASIVHRAALSSVLYGAERSPGSADWLLLAAALRGDWGALLGEERLSAIPFRILDGELSSVGARRYSARQRRSMNWPGLVGHLDLQLLDARCWPLLRFAEAVGLGKNTTFGFGALQLSERPAPSVWCEEGAAPALASC